MAMREIVLDTETTGLDPATGDRLVEIGCVELVNHLPTGVTYHQYINPERDMPAGAFAVHGLSEEFLRNHPVFADVVDEFLSFIGSDRLVIHNAEFDMRFLNAELVRAGRRQLTSDRVVDTLALARRRFPGASASLDALCRRFGVDGSARTLHGALLDSELLAEVYLELMGGRQTGLDFVVRNGGDRNISDTTRAMAPRRVRPNPLPPRLTPQEEAAHAAFVARMGEAALWLRKT
jgi:DNA polymerase-3 subunit epsilon